MRLLFLLILAFTTACSPPAQGGATKPDVTGAADAGPDVAPLFDAAAAETALAEDVTTTADADGAEAFVKGDFVWLTFAVDDSANQTFADGDIQWTGSFAWDEKTNSVVYATSWLPTDGPFVALYDDGPQPSGHEREGAAAGDHIFSNQVKFVADKDTTFEYGALNEFNNWMWVGANGTFTILAGQGGTFTVPGMKLKKFGAINAMIRIDTKALHKAYAGWNTADYKFFVKGTLNQWTPVQLLDDGQKGDEAAGDGILTFVLKNNLGKHDGPLSPGDEVQFTFVTTQGDAAPEDGQEYKQGGNGLPDGVAAWTGTGAGGAWESVPVVLAKDSKGKTLNTAFVVPGKPSAGCDPACGNDETCQEGTCVKLLGCNPPCASDALCVKNSCVKVGTCNPPCTGTDTCVNGACLPAPGECKPACSGGATCVNGSCVPPAPVPTLTGIEPTWTAAKGGGTVTLLGSNLSALFGVQFTPVVDATLGGSGSNPTLVAGKGLAVTTPALPPVFADVTVTPTGGPQLKLSAALDVVPIDSPTVDGVLASDWHPMSFAALNDTLSNWDDPIDLTKTNEIKQLWIAYDAVQLYIGLKALSEAKNAIACYLDVDYGAATGIASPSAILDSSGAVDNALGNVYGVEDSQIGIDVAFATVGMASFAGGDLGASTAAGWRGTSPASNLPWLQGVVQAKAASGAVEASIALSQLYPNGVPPSGAQLRIACVLINADGSAASNQTVPQQANPPSPTTLATWWSVHVYPVSP